MTIFFTSILTHVLESTDTARGTSIKIAWMKIKEDLYFIVILEDLQLGVLARG